MCCLKASSFKFIMFTFLKNKFCLYIFISVYDTYLTFIPLTNMPAICDLYTEFLSQNHIYLYVVLPTELTLVLKSTKTYLPLFMNFSFTVHFSVFVNTVMWLWIFHNILSGLTLYTLMLLVTK